MGINKEVEVQIDPAPSSSGNNSESEASSTNLGIFKVGEVQISSLSHSSREEPSQELEMVDGVDSEEGEPSEREKMETAVDVWHSELGSGERVVQHR